MHRGKRAGTAGAPFSRPPAGSTVTARHGCLSLKSANFLLNTRWHAGLRSCTQATDCARRFGRLSGPARRAPQRPPRALNGASEPRSAARRARWCCAPPRASRSAARARDASATSRSRSVVVGQQPARACARSALESRDAEAQPDRRRRRARPRAARRCRRRCTGSPRPSPRARPGRTARRSTARRTGRRSGRASAARRRRSSRGTCRARVSPSRCGLAP